MSKNITINRTDRTKDNSKYVGKTVELERISETSEIYRGYINGQPHIFAPARDLAARFPQFSDLWNVYLEKGVRKSNNIYVTENS